MQTLYVREYGYIAQAVDGNPVQESDGVRIAQADFLALKHMLLSQAATEESDPIRPASPAKNLFRLTSRAGQEALQVKNYAGVIKLPSGRSLEILPKIFIADHPDPAQCYRSVLIKMLQTLPKPPFRVFREAGLASGQVQLLEAYIACFLDAVGELIGRGICSDYKTREGNHTFLKGKLLVQEQTRQNAARKDRLYVRYDEFGPDRPENRLIKAALLQVAELSNYGDNLRRCRIHLDAFWALPAASSIAADFKACRRDRNLAHYGAALEWCRLLLYGESPIPQAGRHQCLSLLFRMEKMFEEYVAATLTAKLAPAGWRVMRNIRAEHLVEDHAGAAMFVLEPDLLLVKGNMRCVADVKWKIVRGAGDIEHRDLTQMFTYAEKYLSAEPLKRTFLIYPQTEPNSLLLEPFCFNPESKLYVVPYNLLSDECDVLGMLSRL